MAASSHGDGDHSSPPPDSEDSIPARRRSFRPAVPPKDLYLSLDGPNGLTTLPSASPRLNHSPQPHPSPRPQQHQRNFTYDHYPIQSAPSHLQSRLARGRDHTGSVDTALPLRSATEATPETRSFSLEDSRLLSQQQDDVVSVRDLDVYENIPVACLHGRPYTDTGA